MLSKLRRVSLVMCLMSMEVVGNRGWWFATKFEIVPTRPSLYGILRFQLSLA